MKWFYIGNGSTFDADMDVSEKIANFNTVGEKIDIDVLYHYYYSALLSYWIKLEEQLAINTVEELKDYYLSTPYGGGGQQRRNVYKNLLQNFNENVKPEYHKYKERFNQFLSNIEALYKSLISNITPEGKDKLVREINECFKFIADLACGTPGLRKHKDSDIHGLFPLVNDSGWHSYNSYLYALINGAHLIGFPSTISEADGMLNCPAVFANHDVGHTSAILTLDIKELRYYYELVLRDGSLNKTQKEAVIFTIWMLIHELFTPITDANMKWLSSPKTFTAFANLNFVNTFGLTIDSSLFDVVNESLATVSSASLINAREYLKQYEKDGRVREDQYYQFSAVLGSAEIAMIYGVTYLTKLPKPDYSDSDSD